MIKTWHQFESIRHSGRPLLGSLAQLNHPVLIAGCQRSGTTAVTRLLRSAQGFNELKITADDELDAALLLAGELSLPDDERLVLQTTYLNNHYLEYLDHQNFQLVWLVRRPDAVVHSMLSNWSRSALRRLFRACGSLQLNARDKKRYQRFGHWPFSRLDMACYSYVEKARQAGELAAKLPNSQLAFVDYDELVSNPKVAVQRLCRFFAIEYSPTMADELRQTSQAKADSGLSSGQKKRISELCEKSWGENRCLAAGQHQPNEMGS